MPESPIRKLVPFAQEAKKRGINVFHLNIGQPDIETPKGALEAVKNNTIKILSYAESEGSETYRKKLANYYASQHIDVDPEDILITTGGSEALSFVLGTVADTEDEIIVPEPFYANYYGFAFANGVKIIPITSRFENNFALPPIAEFEKLITPKTKAILINNPNNPTGYLYSKEEIKKLCEIVKKHNIFLISDEVYREFIYEDEGHYSVLQEENIKENAILIDSVSKRYSMCGARIGCIVSKNKNVIKTALRFAQARLSPPSYSLLASEAALDTPQSYFNEVKEEYLGRRNLLVSELKKIDEVKVSVPNGAFYCIVELPIKDTDDFAKWLLKDFSFNNETIMVAPAAGFYATEGMGKNQVRIAYVLEKESLKRAVLILKKALKSYCNK